MNEYVVTNPSEIDKLIKTAVESGGGTIFFPNGTYAVNDITLQPKSPDESNGIYFTGESRDGTILRWNGNGTGVLFRLGVCGVQTRAVGVSRMTLDGRIEDHDTLNIAQSGIIAESIYESLFEDIYVRHFDQDALRAANLFIANTIRRVKTEQIHRNGLFIGSNCNANRIESCRFWSVRGRSNAVAGAGIRFDGEVSFSNTIASCVIESNDIGIDIIGGRNPQKVINITQNHFENNRDVDIQAIGLDPELAMHSVSIRNNWIAYGPDTVHPVHPREAIWLRLGAVRWTEVVGNENTKWGVEFIDEKNTQDCYFAGNQPVQFHSDFRPQFLERQSVLPV